MIRTYAVWFVLAYSCVALSAQDAPKPGERLQKAFPKVWWKLATATSVDIDCDGKPDTFYWGIEPEVTHKYFYEKKYHTVVYPEVSFGFEFGSDAKPQKRNVPFIKNTGYYGFRTEPNKIEVQALSCEWEGRPLPGCVKKNDRCQSMWVRDGKGFEAFVFWNSEFKEASWVRH
jgi:hypothetical protein